MSPKSLLRDRRCRSTLDEMAEGTSFQRIIPDQGEASQNPEAVKKLVFCTGKIYYDIRDKRDESGLSGDIAVTRIEQVSVIVFKSSIACLILSSIDIFGY